VDKLKNSKILITCQGNTFGEPSSKILLKPSGILLFFGNSEKSFCLIYYAVIRLKVKQIESNLNSNTLLLSINGNYMEFCLTYMVWWFFETKAFCALRKKAKIGKLQRLKMGLGMSNIELK